MENIIIFNYVIVLFSVTTLLGFFIYNVNQYYAENEDLNLIIDNSEKVCLKINYNGHILNYNKKFQELTLDPYSNNLEGSEFFKIVKFKDTEPMLKFISDLEEKNTATVKLEILTLENKTVSISFVGSSKKNLFGVINQYIFVGTDISNNENILKELNSIKDKNKSLHAELAYSEEELQRNFEQIKYKQTEVNLWCEKHRLFMNSIDEGILEYDFYSRQFYMSRQFQKLFMPDSKITNNYLNFNEFLKPLIDALDEDSYIKLLEQTYEAINNKTESYQFSIKFKSFDSPINVKCNLFLDKDGNLFYFVMSTAKKKNEVLVSN